MLHLTFAPDATLLVKSLCEILKILWRDPFCSPLIVVPNFVVERWLKEKMIAEWGVILEPEISSLEKVLWKVLNPKPQIELLDKEKLQQIIIPLLRREILTKEYFTPLLNYIGKEDDISSEKRRIQIAGEIARLLLEYEYNRPSVWENYPTGKGRWKVYGVEKTWLTYKKLYFVEKVKKDLKDSFINMELWQKDLYLKIFGEGGIVGPERYSSTPNSKVYLTLPQLYIYKHDMYLQTGESIFSGEEPIVIFLLNKISHFHRNMLLEISEKRDIYVFLVNVCSEFWEDVDTSRREAGRKKWKSGSGEKLPIKKFTQEEFEKEELYLPYVEENSLLALWGKSGRENITLWCQGTNYNFEYLPPLQESMNKSSILKKIQMSILQRQSPCLSNIPSDDNSISILCAPEIGREVETLRENILEVLYHHPNIKIEDIGIYVTNMQKYLPFIYKVFGAFEPSDVGYIPYTIIGIKSSESLFVRAIKDFLKLCEGEFTRTVVFSFLSNRLVLKAIEITDEEIEIWKKWTLATGFFRGFDANHRKEMGDPEEIATDEHTFTFGMARLLLGSLSIYSVPLRITSTSIDKDNIQPLPYIDFNTSDKELIEKYCRIIEELSNSCRKLVKICCEKTPSEIVSEFISLCNNWIDTSRTEEENIKNSFIENLLNITLQEELCNCKHFSFNYFKELVMSNLPEEIFPVSLKLSGNLVFYPLRAGYIIPHKIIFVLGLDEESFPGYNSETSLNLLYCKRIIGDPDEVSDNRYTFLELLCAASEKIFLSWVGIDILKDKVISPSSVLLELTNATGLALPIPTVKNSSVIPLSPYETIKLSEAIPCWNPTYARLAFINQSKMNVPSKVEKITLKNENLKLRKDFYEINVEDIAIFLRNPLEYHLKKTLSLKGEYINEISYIIDEPLTSNYTYLLKRHIFYSILSQHLQHKDNHDYMSIGENITKNIYKRWCSSGNAPEGIFLKIELNKFIIWAQKTLRNIIQTIEKYPESKIIDLEDKNEDYFTHRFEFNNVKYKIKINSPFILLSETSLKQALLVKVSSFDNNKWLWSKNLELWLYSLLLSIKGFNKIENSIISYDDGEIHLKEWCQPVDFNYKKWLSDIILAMIDSNDVTFAPAIWFEKTFEKNPEFNEYFINNFKTLAYQEIEGNRDFSSYRTLNDFLNIMDVKIPDNEAISNIFNRLSPILKG